LGRTPTRKGREGRYKAPIGEPGRLEFILTQARAWEFNARTKALENRGIARTHHRPEETP
jgi:hypothetical protein